MQYSVLLKYPESMTDGALETYYAFVDADNPVQAVHTARIEAVLFQGDEPGYALRDFAVLLVVEGHHLDYSADAENALCTSEREMVTCRECDTATVKAYAAPNRAGDGWIGEECWDDYQERLADEVERGVSTQERTRP
jgi:hypothetical protein